MPRSDINLEKIAEILNAKGFDAYTGSNEGHYPVVVVDGFGKFERHQISELMAKIEAKGKKVDLLAA